MGASLMHHVARNTAGWEACLARFEHGDRDFDWQTRFDHYMAQFSPTLGAQEGPPAGA